VRSWFTDAVRGNPGVGGGDITRDQHKLAFQTGENNSTLSVYSLSPGVPTSWRDGEDNPAIDPIVCYRYGGPIGGEFGIPSFAPDGGRMAFAVGDGIHVAAVPDFGGGCTTDGATVTPPLVIPGGKEPDWGPADVPGSRPSPGGGGGGAGGAGGQSKLIVAVSRARLEKALRNGLKVTVKVPAPGKLSATAARKGKTVATAAKKPVAAGRRTLTLKFGRTARRTLARSRSVRLTLKVTFVPTAGAPATATKAVTLK
jgi:hypothetical protein